MVRMTWPRATPAEQFPPPHLFEADSDNLPTGGGRRETQNSVGFPILAVCFHR